MGLTPLSTLREIYRLAGEPRQADTLSGLFLQSLLEVLNPDIWRRNVDLALIGGDPLTIALAIERHVRGRTAADPGVIAIMGDGRYSGAPLACLLQDDLLTPARAAAGPRELKGDALLDLMQDAQHHLARADKARLFRTPGAHDRRVEIVAGIISGNPSGIISRAPSEREDLDAFVCARVRRAMDRAHALGVRFVAVKAPVQAGYDASRSELVLRGARTKGAAIGSSAALKGAARECVHLAPGDHGAFYDASLRAFDAGMAELQEALRRAGADTPPRAIRFADVVVARSAILMSGVVSGPGRRGSLPLDGGDAATRSGALRRLHLSTGEPASILKGVAAWALDLDAVVEHG